MEIDDRLDLLEVSGTASDRFKIVKAYIRGDRKIAIWYKLLWANPVASARDLTQASQRTCISVL